MEKAIFLDRDGTINENIYEVDGKIMSPAKVEQLKIIPGVREGVAEFKKMGFKLIVLTNQPGVPFGYIRREKLDEINNFLKKELNLDAVYCCIHGPKENCSCRKPKIGLVLQSSKDFGIDLKKSYVVGDSLSDIQTGKNAGVKKNFLIGIDRIDARNIMHKENIFPDFICANLLEVAEKIKSLEKI